MRFYVIRQLYGKLFYILQNIVFCFIIILFNDFSERLRQPMIELLVSSNVFPKLSSAIYGIMRVDNFIVGREVVFLAIQNTHYHIINLNIQSIQTSLLVQMLEMS